jgi:hypothetical protein
MSESFVLPGLRDRILSGAGIVRGLRVPMPANARMLASATVAAAAIAGAMTWVQSAYMPSAPATMTAAAPLSMPQAIERPPPATTTIGKTHELVDTLAGLRSDPTLHLEASSAWRPAGGLAILTSPSTAPNDRLASLPMPAPIVAAVNPPPTATAEVDDVPLPRANPTSVAAVPVKPNNAAAAVVATAPDATVESKPSSGGFFGMLERFFAPQDRRNASAALASNPRTAIYDISAHVVYMPNGETLEAHSGLGQWLDDPSSFNRKDRGVTPPATYKISMREKPFHGVQALRLTPVGEAQMYGRDGMLAHSYMLGPNGQSNGCVSFKDYDKFLAAYASGAVDRLIVVPKLTSTTAYAQASSSS